MSALNNVRWPNGLEESSTEDRRNVIDVPLASEKDFDRFWSKVNKTTDGCWEWTAASFANGYGQFWFGNTMVYAHRFSFEQHMKTKLNSDIHVHHICENKICINPFHLKAKTRFDHMSDHRKGKKYRYLGNRAKLAVSTRGDCPRGHQSRYAWYWSSLNQKHYQRCMDCYNERRQNYVGSKESKLS